MEALDKKTSAFCAFFFLFLGFNARFVCVCVRQVKYTQLIVHNSHKKKKSLFAYASQQSQFAHGHCWCTLIVRFLFSRLIAWTDKCRTRRARQRRIWLAWRLTSRRSGCRPRWTYTIVPGRWRPKTGRSPSRNGRWPRAKPSVWCPRPGWRTRRQRARTRTWRTANGNRTPTWRAWRTRASAKTSPNNWWPEAPERT